MTRGRKNDIKKKAGENNEEEIPVPMPNTEVKLLGAENTYELPCWEDRKLPVFFNIKSSIAQLVDTETVNEERVVQCQ